MGIACNARNVVLCCTYEIIIILTFLSAEVCVVDHLFQDAAVTEEGNIRFHCVVEKSGMLVPKDMHSRGAVIIAMVAGLPG